MILLDTHVLVRYTRDEGRLGRRVLSTIDRAVVKNELFVSASPCGGADQTQSGHVLCAPIDANLETVLRCAPLVGIVAD